MNSPATVLVLLVALAGLVFFTLRWLQLRATYNAMSGVERTYTQMSADTEKTRRRRNTGIARLRRRVDAYGFGRSLWPLALIVVFAFVAAAAGLRLVGIDQKVSVLAAAPAAILGGVVAYQWSIRRRVDRFNNQMITLLDMLTAQVKAGNGVERSLATISPGLPQPIRGELDKALDAASSGGDLIDALRTLSEQYPSRAFSMFLAALEIDRSDGHSITDALSQASELLKRGFVLQSEARAELASTRWEFIGVTLILMGIAFKMVFGGVTGSEHSVYTSPVGIAVLGLCAGNVALGIWRFNRLIARIRKDTE